MVLVPVSSSAYPALPVPATLKVMVCPVSAREVDELPADVKLGKLVIFNELGSVNVQLPVCPPVPPLTKTSLFVPDKLETPENEGPVGPVNP